MWTQQTSRYQPLAMKREATTLFIENSRLGGTNLSVMSLLTLQLLLPTTWAKQLQTKCFLIFTVINASATLNTARNAKCACPAFLSRMFFPLTTLSWAVINKPQVLASWAHLNINCTIIIAGQIKVSSVIIMWLVGTLLHLAIHSQQETQLFKMLRCNTIKPTNS